MKLKKVASLCSKANIFCLYDREESDDRVSQWLGEMGAIYPITGLPYMDEENIYSMFDIPAKKQEKITFRHQRAPEEFNLSDTDPTERRISEENLSVVYDGGVLKPLQTRNGITFIQSRYLAPLEDVADMVQLYERRTPQGATYIVAKTGFSFRRSSCRITSSMKGSSTSFPRWRGNVAVRWKRSGFSRPRRRKQTKHNAESMWTKAPGRSSNFPEKRRQNNEIHSIQRNMPF